MAISAVKRAKLSDIAKVRRRTAGGQFKKGKVTFVSANNRYVLTSDLKKGGGINNKVIKRLVDDIEKTAISVMEDAGDSIVYELDRITREARNIMANAITRGNDTDNAKNSEGNLIKFLEPELVSISSTRVEFKIGIIDTLNDNVPYWYVLNYGRTQSGTPFLPPKNRGYFEGDTWVHTGDRKDYLLQPKTYTPVPYLTLAEDYIQVELAKLNMKMQTGY